MYKIHVTEGIVIGVYPQGEVDSFYYVFTKEYGLLGLTATGIKLQKSKLKSSLQLFSRVEVGFVKGKSALRVTHATLVDRPASIYDMRFFARLLERLRRMVKGEEKNEELYDLIVGALASVQNAQTKKKEERFGLEMLFTMRLLHSLGYWAEELRDKPFLSAPIDEALALEGYVTREFFIERIQKALEESQL